MNELYLQDYILKQISRKYNHKHHKNHPAEELKLLFGRITKDSFHKSIPNFSNLTKALIQEVYIYPDHSVSPLIDELNSSNDLCLPDEYVKYAGLIFGSLKNLLFSPEVTPAIFKETCKNLKALGKEGFLKITKIAPIKRPDVSTKGNISGVSIKYEYGKSFPKLNWYYTFGKYSLEHLTQNDVFNLLATIGEIEKNVTILSKKIEIHQKPNPSFMGNAENHKNIRLDCLTYLKRNNAIIDFKTINNPPSDDIIEIETKHLGVESFVGKLLNTKIGKSTMLSEPEVENSPIETPNEIVFELTCAMDNKILLNKKTLIAQPQYDSENDVVFQHLIKHPNQSFTKSQIEKITGRTINKTFHKILNHLGFKRDLRRLFFKASKNKIIFRNPIYQKTIDELKIDLSKLQQLIKPT